MIQSSIYYGEVLHSRNHPKKHSFKYKYRSLFNKNIYDFKLKKFNKFKFSFSSYDFHEDIISEKIIKWFERYIEKNSLKVDHISLDLLKTPNLFLRKSFNPVCFWFLKQDDKTISYIAEVTNTFKEKQVYYIQNQGKEIENNIWFEVDKKMYVSPFADKIGKYKFQLDDQSLTIKINEFDPSNNLEIVTRLSGTLMKYNRLNFLYFICSLYLNSLSVLPKIHYQAFHLWRKKLKVFSHKGNGYAE
jgi:DUF1365 family protein